MTQVSYLSDLALYGSETFGMEVLNDTPLPLPVLDMGSLRANTLYSYRGLHIYIEYIKGDVRKGRDPQGNEWSMTMPTAYGYLPGIIDADGEDFDVYLNQADFSDLGEVFLLDQYRPGMVEFDEHKGFIGYPTEQSAYDDYAKVVPKAGQRAKLPVELSWEGFVAFLRSDAVKRPYQNADGKGSTLGRVSEKTKIGIPLSSPAPKILTNPQEKGVAIEIYILSTFNEKDWGGTTETIIDLIESATEEDSILIGVSSYGGSLDLACRIASAIRMTKAHVTTISLGPVASAGCLVWCEGHTRLISVGSYFMQHEASTIMGGKTSKIAKTAQMISDYVSSVIFPRPLEVGLLTKEEISTMIHQSRDIYISAATAAKRTGAKLV